MRTEKRECVVDVSGDVNPFESGRENVWSQFSVHNKTPQVGVCLCVCVASEFNFQ